MLTDLRHAFRSVFRSHLRSTSVILLTLTVGLGIGTAIFTVADSVIFRAMPFGNQDRLVTIWASAPAKGIEHLEINWSDLERFDQETDAIEDFAAWSAANFPIVFVHDGVPFELPTNLASSSFFEMLAVQPLRGRLFQPADQNPGAPGVVLISHDMWQTRFGGAEEIVGQTLTAGGESLEIIGILPPHLNLPRDADVILSLEAALPEPQMRESRTLGGLALLRSGVSLNEARQQIAVVAKRIAGEKPDTHEGVEAVLQPLRDEVLGPLDGVLRLMFAMGLLLIVIAWANVAGTLLTQIIGRRRELAIRSGMGASHRHLLRQLVLELALIGAVAIAASWLAVRAAIGTLIRIAPSDLPRLSEIGPRLPSIVFLVAAVVAGIAILTAIHSMRLRRISLGRVLVEGSSRATLSGRTRRALDLLVVTQIAATLVLLVVAANFTASFRELTRIDPGFDRENVVTAHIPLGYVFGEEAATRRQFFIELLRRIDALPGVQAAGTVLMRPLEIEQGWDLPFTIEGQDLSAHELNPMGNLLSVTPGYFSAIGLGIVSGRPFGWSDTPDSELVVIVSRSFAERYWNLDAAIGKRFKRGRPDSDQPWLRIIGVVDDARYRGLTTEKLDVYVPYTQTIWSPNYLAVRSTSDPAALVPAIRAILFELRPDVPLSGITTTAELVDKHLAQPRLTAIVATAFASAALIVSLLGLYSVLSYGVTRRLPELGIRMTLGATTRDLVRMVFRESLTICIAGLTVGTLATIVSIRLAGGLFLEADRVAPSFLVLSAALLFVVALAATIRPAWNATRADPIDSVRAE